MAKVMFSLQSSVLSRQFFSVTTDQNFSPYFFFYPTVNDGVKEKIWAKILQ